MGLRHRSIRLRVGLLILVPVLALLGLYGFAASITLGNALAQAHAKSIRNELVAPLSSFEKQLDIERHLALLSLASPATPGLQSSLVSQERVTNTALNKLKIAMAGPAMANNGSSAERQAIDSLLGATQKLSSIRGKVAAHAVSLSAALSDYDAIVSACYTVLDESLAQQTNVSFVTQALDAITLDRVTQTTLEESDLLAGDFAQAKFPATDRIYFAQLANYRQSMAATALPELQPQYRTLVDRSVTPAISSSLTDLERNVIATPWRVGAPPSQLVAATGAFSQYSTALDTALMRMENELEAQAQHNADTVFAQLLLAAGLGLLGTIASIALSLIIGRGLVRQLRELRESALTLAHEKLPSVISRLRAGEQVDIDEYAPTTEIATSNEIEQVQEAFGVVQQTAVQSAVDEARLRRGISDVFRNLAGRSQSLLHRQLTLLDGMERRATEPEQLDDLFRIDHLTTRMRRHAEGLIILSGETPARGWRQPVPLVDVLRAAVAEVEDYTRIRVMARTGAAVAGHAVADVIHLIAELAENATVFSPPTTPVRIQGDVVGRGFAVEIEDRGLGISAARLEEINANLANPPQFDLSGSDRLGLFIAGQLAQRHEIKVTLRPSVYGGTTAIVLIPTALVVEEDSFERQPALPTGRQASLDTSRMFGRHAALPPSNGRTSDGGAWVTAEFELDYSVTGLAISDRAAADVPDALSASQRELSVLASSNGDDADARIPTSEVAELGLPVRVRQASLAPQLRNPPAATASPTGASSLVGGPLSGGPLSGGPLSGGSMSDSSPAGSSLPGGSPHLGSLPSRPTPASPFGSRPHASDPGAGDRSWAHLTAPQPAPSDSGSQDGGEPVAGSPEAARNTVNALQRGWQLGRSQNAESPSGLDPAEPTATIHGFDFVASRQQDPADSADQQGTE